MIRERDGGGKKVKLNEINKKLERDCGDWVKVHKKQGDGGIHKKKKKSAQLQMRQWRLFTLLNILLQ